MVTAYKILRERFGDDAKPENDIEKLVNQAIQEGWTPLGGVCETVDNYRVRYFAQAMIKEGEK